MSQTDATVTVSDPCRAAEVHVGTPSPAFNHWERIMVYFHDFANQPVTTDEAGGVESSTFSCLGYQWRLLLELNKDTRHDKVWLDFFLLNLSTEDITVKYCISIKDYDDYNVYEYGEPPTQILDDSYHHWNGRISHQGALNSLVYGTLVVEVSMKRPRDPWDPLIPPNPSVCETIQTLFMDESTADVVFQVRGTQVEALVGSESAGDKTTKQHTDEPNTFFAHSLILKKATPLLAEMCASDDNDGVPTPTTIQIPNVQPETFYGLLHYIYGLKIPNFGADISHTKEIIEAADRYGLTNLKLKAEACYVSSMTVTMENVMEHLHFADSKNCALLKEAIIDFIVENKGTIIENRIMADAPINLANDILAAIWRIEKKGQRDYVNDSFDVMSINELRERAYYEGVEEDGSRESLVASLKQVKVADAVEGEDEEVGEEGGEEAQAAEMEE
jgi:hypothetical protein